MQELDGEDEPTVIITNWPIRDITTPPILERQVGPPEFEAGSLAGSHGEPAPAASRAGWMLAASVALAAVVVVAGLVVGALGG